MAAAAADKARFYLEQSVPELQAYKEKGIFTPAEISAIASKRSEFEHRINMAGVPTPTDFARYASYEQTLDALRRKRCRRKGVRGTHFAGQKRVFSILERGTRRFPGDLGLWMQYLEFCKGEAANAKLNKGLTKVLRMHPTKWELWVWAASHFFDQQGDMATARSFMQRGLRFCARERDLWIQYLRLEMVYLAKVAARRKILKLDEEVEEEKVEQDDKMDADEVALPDVTMEEMNPTTRDKALSIDDATLKKLADAPAFTGAIPMAIADAAAKTFNGETALFEDLFDATLEFTDVPSAKAVLQHIISLAPENAKASSVRNCMEAKLELAGLKPSSAEFPAALGRAILRIKSLPSASFEDDSFKHQRMVTFLVAYLRSGMNVDPDVETVLTTTCRHHIKALRAVAEKRPLGRADPVHTLQKTLGRRDVKKKLLVELGLLTEVNG